MPLFRLAAGLFEAEKLHFVWHLHLTFWSSRKYASLYKRNVASATSRTNFVEVSRLKLAVTPLRQETAH